MTEILDIFADKPIKPQGAIQTQPENRLAVDPGFVLTLYVAPCGALVYVDGVYYGDTKETVHNKMGVECGNDNGTVTYQTGCWIAVHLHDSAIGSTYEILVTKAGYMPFKFKYTVSKKPTDYLDDHVDMRSDDYKDICMHRFEDDVDIPPGSYDPRDRDIEFEFKAPALNDVPALGMPIGAYRVLLGSYSFTYGAHDHISVNQKHVIVRFPVAHRNGTIKQTTGSDDVDYQWEGNIVSSNIHNDMKAIRAISEAGEPVDFFYLGQKKKVLLEQFDYEIFHNCRAKYTIKVTEYYPQKIKFIPVRVDPLIPERWGILPPVSPIDPNAPDEDDCRCSLQYKDGTGQPDVIPGHKFIGQDFEYPEGILIDEIKDMFGDLNNFLNKYLSFFQASTDEVYRRILSIALNKLFRWVKENWSLTCLMWLFRDCQREQEKFYKDILLLYMLNGVYIQWQGEKYPLLFINEDKSFVDGTGDYDAILFGIIYWFEERLHDGTGVPLTKAEIYAWLNPPNTCDDMAQNVNFVETSRVAIKEKCIAYKHILQARRNAEKKGRVTNKRKTLKELLDMITLSLVVFEPPALELSQACQEWCEKRRIEGLNPGDSTPHIGVNP